MFVLNVQNFTMVNGESRQRKETAKLRSPMENV